MRIFDFRCEDGHVAEHLVQADCRSVRCDCGKEATRIISPISFAVDGSDPSWPTAHDKWVREHERHGKL